MEDELETLVARAREGDREALDGVVRAIADRVYQLALRMLWHPADAEDAAQEILVKIVTRLGSFRGESAFTTWAYRVASNHLLTTRRRRAEREELTFSRFAEQLGEGLSDRLLGIELSPDERLLVEEVKLGCTQGMLLCLDREHRLAHVLGDVFGITGEQGGEILGITPVAFRKRLSRARERLRTFVRAHCGLVSDDASCRCVRRVDAAVRTGRVDPDHLLFANHFTRTRTDDRLTSGVHAMEAFHDAAALFRSHPDYAAPERMLAGIRRVLAAHAPAILALE